MELINKDTVVTKIDNLIGNLRYTVDDEAVQIDILSEVEKFINTLEVKEVDLDKIIKEEYLKQRCYRGKDNMLVILTEPDFNKITKHFFELGLKAQKGE